jgi:hypothetical protein
VELAEHGTLGEDGFVGLPVGVFGFGLVEGDVGGFGGEFEGFLAEVKLFFKAFVGGVVKVEFEGGIGNGEDETEGGGHDFEPRGRFNKPFSGNVDFVHAFFGVIGIE